MAETRQPILEFHALSSLIRDFESYAPLQQVDSGVNNLLVEWNSLKRSVQTRLNHNIDYDPFSLVDAMQTLDRENLAAIKHLQDGLVKLLAQYDHAIAFLIDSNGFDGGDPFLGLLGWKRAQKFAEIGPRCLAAVIEALLNQLEPLFEHLGQCLSQCLRCMEDMQATYQIKWANALTNSYAATIQISISELTDKARSFIWSSVVVSEQPRNCVVNFDRSRRVRRPSDYRGAWRFQPALRLLGGYALGFRVVHPDAFVVCYVVKDEQASRLKYFNGPGNTNDTKRSTTTNWKDAAFSYVTIADMDYQHSRQMVVDNELKLIQGECVMAVMPSEARAQFAVQVTANELSSFEARYEHHLDVQRQETRKQNRNAVSTHAYAAFRVRLVCCSRGAAPNAVLDGFKLSLPFGFCVGQSVTRSHELHVGPWRAFSLADGVCTALPLVRTSHLVYDAVPKKVMKRLLQLLWMRNAEMSREALIDVDERNAQSPRDVLTPTRRCSKNETAVSTVAVARCVAPIDDTALEELFALIFGGDVEHAQYTVFYEDMKTSPKDKAFKACDWFVETARMVREGKDLLSQWNRGIFGFLRNTHIAAKLISADCGAAIIRFATQRCNTLLINYCVRRTTEGPVEIKAALIPANFLKTTLPVILTGFLESFKLSVDTLPLLLPHSSIEEVIYTRDGDHKKHDRDSTNDDSYKKIASPQNKLLFSSSPSNDGCAIPEKLMALPSLARSVSTVSSCSYVTANSPQTAHTSPGTPMTGFEREFQQLNYQLTATMPGHCECGRPFPADILSTPPLPPVSAFRSTHDYSGNGNGNGYREDTGNNDYTDLYGIGGGIEATTLTDNGTSEQYSNNGTNDDLLHTEDPWSSCAWMRDAFDGDAVSC